MSEGIVASMQGNWSMVAAIVNTVFGGLEFTLLAERCDPTAPPHFQPRKELNSNELMPRGRAFNSSCEVRWRETEKGCFTVTYLSESLPPPTEAGLILSATRYDAAAGRGQKLYGKWSDTLDDWVEVSVPGVSKTYDKFFGASPQPNSLQVTAVDYLIDGCIQMTRLCQVKEFK
jgi:hypothetical protein